MLNLIAREFVGFERAFARQLAAYGVEHPGADVPFEYLDVPPLYNTIVEQRGTLHGRDDLFLAVTDLLPDLSTLPRVCPGATGRSGAGESPRRCQASAPQAAGAAHR